MVVANEKRCWRDMNTKLFCIAEIRRFENNSSQEPPITAVLNFSMYSLLRVSLFFEQKRRVFLHTMSRGENTCCPTHTNF